MKKIIVYITFPSKKEAEKICQILINEKLVACANVFQISSIFRWRGKIKREKEFGTILKTKENFIKKIIKKVKELHSYKIPCIISFEIKKGNKDFLNWIDESIK